MKLINSLIVAIPLVFVGCDFVKVKDPVAAVEKVEYSQEAKEVAESMKDMSDEHKKLMYMQFGGLSEYLSKTNKIEKTADLLKVIQSFQTDYGYTKGQYSSYTDAVEKFLTNKGYKTPKSIVQNPTSDKEISRSQVIKDIRELGDAAKLAMETNKNG